MPTTILDGETYEEALHRRCAEEAADFEDDGLWPCMNIYCDGRVQKDGDFCDECQADDEDDTCGHCCGTGEVSHDGARCIVCGGKGYVRNFDPDDFDPPEDR